MIGQTLYRLNGNLCCIFIGNTIRRFEKRQRRCKKRRLWTVFISFSKRFRWQKNRRCHCNKHYTYACYIGVQLENWHFLYIYTCPPYCNEMGLLFQSASVRFSLVQIQIQSWNVSFLPFSDACYNMWRTPNDACYNAYGMDTTLFFPQGASLKWLSRMFLAL